MHQRKSDRTRYLYSGFIVLLLVLTFLGFQHFYLRGSAYPGRPLTPPIRTLLIAHGVSMSVWMILLIAQSLLITRGHYRVHMFLGKAGAVLAAAIVIMGVQVAIGATRVNPPDFELWGLVPPQFMAVSLSAIILFGVFVAIGIWKRRRPEIHKPMMLLGTMSATGAAIDRVGPLKHLYEHTPWGQVFGPYFPLLIIGAAFLLLKGTLTKSLDRPFLAGYAAMMALGALVMAFAATPMWESIAGWLLR